MVLYYFPTVQQISFRDTSSTRERCNKPRKITSFTTLESFLKAAIDKNT
jgi:hypothetical protein